MEGDSCIEFSIALRVSRSIDRLQLFSKLFEPDIKGFGIRADYAYSTIREGLNVSLSFRSEWDEDSFTMNAQRIRYLQYLRDLLRTYCGQSELLESGLRVEVDELTREYRTNVTGLVPARVIERHQIILLCV